MESTGTTGAPSWATPSSSSAHGSAQGSAGGGAAVEEQHGQSSDPSQFLSQPYSTLDEPVRETIMRDVRSVATKLRVVLLPLDRNTHFGYSTVATDEVQPGENQRQVINKLREWDLWGPLIVCLALSVILSLRAPTNEASAVFAAVFVAVWVGSAVVTCNGQMLGGTISFFQSVCVLGYCVFPMMLSALLILLLEKTWFGVVWVDLVWVALGFVWATRASTVFIGQYIRRERRSLAVYPVFFFYTFLGWLILLF